ncbi:MAG: glutathione S-transferase family protein [Parasphingorhabdus sp.]
MKLYTTHPAPNPFRVKVFLAEKGIDLPIQNVDIMSGETRQAEFLDKNSLGELPVLELDDGMILTETIAICRYLEQLYPEKPLLGENSLETAKIEMWTRRMEQQILAPLAQIGLHTFPIFADKIEQIPEYAETQKRLAVKRWAWLNGELSDGRTYVVDDRFSVADITGMAALMVCNFSKEEVPVELSHVKRWEAAVRSHKAWGG